VQCKSHMAGKSPKTGSAYCSGLCVRQQNYGTHRWGRRGGGGDTIAGCNEIWLTCSRTSAVDVKGVSKKGQYCWVQSVFFAFAPAVLSGFVYAANSRSIGCASVRQESERALITRLPILLCLSAGRSQQ